MSYCKIVAPADGIVTRKSVEIDQNIAPGQNLLTLVSLEDIWITANFKETQLKRMQAGQSVKIHVDATGKDYSGRVTQIGGATGSVLSLFPPENATGNYVKVVQRLAGAHRLHRPCPRGPEPPAPSRTLRRAQSPREVKAVRPRLKRKCTCCI